MKGHIAVAVMLAAGSLLASDPGANTFGLLRVDSDQARTIVAIPWIQASLTNGEISVADVVKTANLQTGDSIHYYNTSTKAFESWKLNNSKTWDPATSVTVESIISDGTDASKKALTRGNALVLIRPDSGRASCFYLWGQVASSTPTNVISRSENASVYNLIAPPVAASSGTVDINGSDITWDNVQDGDRIYFQTSTNMVECKRMTVDSTVKWQSYCVTGTSTLGKVPVKSYGWADPTPIAAGTGFWYVSTNGTATTKVIWTEAPKVD